MTRKDYVKLARALHESRPKVGSMPVWWNIVLAISSTLKEDNPRFDSEKFFTAVKEG